MIKNIETLKAVWNAAAAASAAAAAADSVAYRAYADALRRMPWCGDLALDLDLDSLSIETLKAEWNATTAAYAAAAYAAATATAAATAAAAADSVAYRAYAAAAARQWLRRTDLDSLSIEIRKQDQE